MTHHVVVRVNLNEEDEYTSVLATSAREAALKFMNANPPIVEDEEITVITRPSRPGVEVQQSDVRTYRYEPRNQYRPVPVAKDECERPSPEPTYEKFGRRYRVVANRRPRRGEWYVSRFDSVLRATTDNGPKDGTFPCDDGCRKILEEVIC